MGCYRCDGGGLSVSVSLCPKCRAEDEREKAAERRHREIINETRNSRSSSDADYELTGPLELGVVFKIIIFVIVICPGFLIVCVVCGALFPEPIAQLIAMLILALAIWGLIKIK